MESRGAVYISEGKENEFTGISARLTDRDMDRETCAWHSLREIKKPTGKGEGEGERQRKKTWEYNDRETVY